MVDNRTLQQKSDFTYVKEGPKLEALLKDKSPRQNKLDSYSFDPKTGKKVFHTFTERAGLVDTNRFLETAIAEAEATNNNEVALTAKAVKSNLVYVGEPEMKEATSGLANHLVEMARKGNVVTIYLSGRNRSERYIALRILEEVNNLTESTPSLRKNISLSESINQVVELCQKYKGNCKVILPDDFVISGSLIKGYAERAAKSLSKAGFSPEEIQEIIEANVVAAPIRQDEEVLTTLSYPDPQSQENVKQSFRMHSYYGVPENSGKERGLVLGNVSITGSHSSTDYGFQTEITRIQTGLKESGIETEIPLTAYVDKPYELEGSTSKKYANKDLQKRWETIQKDFSTTTPSTKVEVDLEQTKIFANPTEDPTIKEYEARIISQTNRETELTRGGFWGQEKAKATEKNYVKEWGRNYSRISAQEWNAFLDLYPEKTVTYRGKFEPISQAFDTREAIQNTRTVDLSVFRTSDEMAQEIASRYQKGVGEIVSMPKKPGVTGEVAKEAATRGAKAGVKRIGAKVATKLGIRAALHGALAGVSAGVANIALEVGSLILRGLKKALSKIGDFIFGKRDKRESVAIMGWLLLAGGIFLGSFPLIIAGGLIGTGALLALMGGIAIGTGLAAYVTSFFLAITAPARAIAASLIVAIIAIPLVVAFIVFIINSGAYVVPQGPPSVSALVENPYIEVEKVARRAGTSAEPQAYLEFENSNLPVTIEYRITVTAKRATLTNINFDWKCTVIRDPDQFCPSYSNVTINGEPAPNVLPPAAPSLISPANPYVITYTQLFRSGLFNDSLVIDTFSVTADVESEGVTQTQAVSSASIRIGDPPDQCPSVWPALPQGGESSLNIYQGAYTGFGFSHRALEALDISTTVGHSVYATHTGVARILFSSCLGNHVEITAICGEEFFSRYAHLEGTDVNTGDVVNLGQRIGISGNTGSCTSGAHLHYEFRYPIGPFSSTAGPYPDNPPYMMRPYTPKDVERGCVDEKPSNICTTTVP